MCTRIKILLTVSERTLQFGAYKKSHRHTMYVIVNTKYQTDFFLIERDRDDGLYFLFNVKVSIFWGKKASNPVTF